MLDVLVVGAGPAGSLAAWRLARAGARVLLVDRARFPRPKLCGDTLNPGAVARLEAGEHLPTLAACLQFRGVAKGWHGEIGDSVVDFEEAFQSGRAVTAQRL